MRPSLATDRISLGLWLDTRFIVNHQGGGGGVGVCVNNPVNIWDRVCVLLHSRWASHQICDPSRMIATWCSHCSVNPLHPQNYICIQFDVSCLYKFNCNLFNHHERLDFFLCISHQQSAISSCWLWWLVIWWLRNDLSIPRAPENMSHKNIITIHFHIFGRNITISLEYLGPLAVFQ